MHTHKKRNNYGAFVALCLATTGVSAQTAEFIPLGVLSGNPEFSSSADISGDGSFIVGTSSSDDSGWNGGLSEAVLWSPDSTARGLGFASGSDRNSRGFAIAPDGRWVVGEDTYSAVTIAMAWSEPTGMFLIGDLPGGTPRSTATGISNGGRVAVGYAGSEQAGEFGAEAFRWTPDGGLEGLGFLGKKVNGRYSSGLQDISANGLISVGGSTAPEHSRALTWTTDLGMQALPMHDEAFIDPYLGGASAKAISHNGEWITGRMSMIDPSGDNEFIDEAVLWTPDGEVIRLGQLYDNNWRRSFALDVSNDGIVVGWSNSIFGGDEPFIWDAEHGMRNFIDVLLDEYGIDTAAMGWQINSLSAITPDGSVIVGTGFNRQFGRTEAFMVRIIPAPSTLTPLAVLGLFASRRRRYKPSA